MRVLHWCLIGFLTAALLPVESKYRFRFHTCIKEDQAILDRENLVSLRQMAFIDDGSFGGRKQRRLSEFGIDIEHGSLLKNFTKEYPVGAESTIHFINFRESEYLILINFWSRSYYFVKKGEKINIRKAGKTLKPSFEHFVRVYFICAPGNARSALILFGEQAKLRMVAPQSDGGERKETQTPKAQKKPKKRSPVLVTQKTADNSTVTLRKCRKRGLRKKRAVGSPKRQFSKKIIRKTPKDERRLARRALLVYRVRIVFVYAGFGLAIIINCFVLIVFFKIYKKSKIPPSKIDSDGEENGKNNEKPAVNGSGTTETKTNSEKNEK
ncbi:hypothetical protein L5515_000148 [Caenorhabditis briggsae]|uniref:Uncharacterized protein n=1 Tax=Caenorhabditis briggsae TaxID=6238 RepID=A0AAE9E1K0_CAEBR|nr:hypothetical protein L5515_000148 [Caenorhabditis briggsae]